MTHQVSTLPAKQIGKYRIASADMFYSEEGERDICVYDDPEQGLRIWAETPMGGPATSIDLCQVFLEYGLLCQSRRDADQSHRDMKSFAENLGIKLANYIKSTSVYDSAADPGACALESVLEAIHAHVTIEHIGPELRFIIAGCPLLSVSEYTGLTEAELAQYGFNVMCQSLIQAVDPHLLLHMPVGTGNCQVLTLVEPTHPLLEAPPTPFISEKRQPAKREETIDAFPPPAMATKAVDIGVRKTGLDTLSTFMLAILAGAFIAMGAIFSTTVSAGGSGLPFGVVRLLAGFVFASGLIMVVVAGAELFTGNNLIIMAFLSGKVTIGALLRNWLLVYIGNFVGAFLTALLMYLSKQYTFGGGAIGVAVLNIGQAKTSLGFVQAIVLGMACNALVCMAIWMCYSARSTIDKILAIIPPIAAFVAAGFEHSIANMYFIPIALFVKYFGTPAFFTAIQKTPADFPNLTWGNFFWANLVPVTIGNIIGGAVMVGVMYWLIYLRQTTQATPKAALGTVHIR